MLRRKLLLLTSASTVIALAAPGIAGAAPTARYSYSPSNPVMDKATAFDGSASSCDRKPCSFSWRDDGYGTSLGTGMRVSHTFHQAGDKFVRLTITNARGRSSSTVKTIHVADSAPPPAVACSNGLDDDADRLVDLADPGCGSANDDDESNVVQPLPAKCANGLDDDGDGLVDSSDPGCTSPTDGDEVNAPSPPPSGSPTLQQVDGGSNYYGQFSNPLPTDPSYFPIGAWLRRADSQAVFDQYRDFGMNVFAGVECPECAREDLIRANGMKAFIQVNERTRFNDIGSETAGWLLGDEIDMTQGPAGCQSMRNIAASLPADGRMRYNNFGKGVGGQFSQTDAEAACFVNNVNLASLDVYWFTDPNESGHPRFEHGFGYGDMVNRLRFLDRMDGKVQPQWNFVELGPAGTGSHRSIQPAEIRSAVWHSVIAGARGILYFDHNFGPGCGGSTILGQCYPANRASAKATNGQIKALAPVLNASTVTSGHSISGAPTRRLVKWDGSNFYVFLGTENGGDATFSMPCVSNATATRLGEAGSVSVTNGQFTDSFADKNAVHIYRLDGGSTCGL